MQKQVNFFEQNVQWFALGLGGLFLAWMLFTYVLQAPVKVAVGSTEMGPGEVDPATLEGPVAHLKRDIANPTIPTIRQRDYVGSFVAAIKGSGDTLALLSPTQIRSRRMEAEALPVVGDDGAIVQGPRGEPGKPVDRLPVPPPAMPGPFVTGRSQITYQDPKWVPRPNRPNEPPGMIVADKDWSTVAFTIKGEQLSKAFADAFDEKKIDAADLDPALFMQTAIVDVELVRREILPGGRATKETVVRPLPLNPTRPPFPGTNAKEFEIFQYISWVTQNPQEIINPAFYEITAGDLWVAPAEENEQLAAADLARMREERRMATEQRKQQQALRKQQRQGGRRGPPMGGPPMGGPPGMAPGGRFVPPPPPPPGGFGMEGMPEDMGMMEDPGMFQGGGGGVFDPRRAAAAVRPGVAGGAQVGPGQFSVIDLPDLQVIAHDDTIEAGKTYQYKIRYKIFNPVYKTTAADAKLTNQFAIPAKDSDWTKPVKMRAKVEFFLAEIKGERTEFEIFQWRDGRTVMTKQSALPGDAIGPTGWSVVDVRGSGTRAYSLLMDPAGQVARRDPERDEPSNRYMQLQDEAGVEVGMTR